MTGQVDPTWLYSTIAQSAAALVAIIGGLLVSRLVALSVDHGSIERRREETAKRLTVVAERRDSNLESITSNAHTHFVAVHLEHVVKLRGELPDDLRMPLGTPPALVEEWRQALSENVKRTFTAVTALLNSEEIEIGLPELRQRGLSAEQFPDEIAILVSQKIARERRPKSLFMTDFDAQSLITRPGTSWADLQRDRLDKFEELNEQVRLLRSEVAILDSQLEDFVAPSGVWWGLGALLGFAILGIAFPLCLIAMRPVPGEAWVRVTAILLFLVGLSLVAIFMVSQARELKTTTQAAPEAKYESPFRV